MQKEDHGVCLLLPRKNEQQKSKQIPDHTLKLTKEMLES
jgi:hypothetical protein